MKQKDQFIQIRVALAQKEAIRARAARAGMDMSSYVLARLLPAPSARFDAILTDLAADATRRRFALAALNDFLTECSATEFLAATAVPPRQTLDAYLANYTAAMIETAASRLGVTAPAWTAAVPPLREPAFGSELPKLRLHLLLNSPPAFRGRNIFVDSTLGSRV